MRQMPRQYAATQSAKREGPIRIAKASEPTNDFQKLLLRLTRIKGKTPKPPVPSGHRAEWKQKNNG